jgi:hypothetical protein
MLKQCRQYHDEREMALALALKEVAAELRLIDAVDLVAFIRTAQFGNVRSLVNASTEMYFKPGTMSFAESGDVSLSWTGEPSIVLDMQFRHSRVDVFFRLLLESEQAGVEIEYISFSGKSPDPVENTRRLIDAIADARFALAAPKPRASTSSLPD